MSDNNLYTFCIRSKTTSYSLQAVTSTRKQVTQVIVTTVQLEIVKSEHLLQKYIQNIILSDAKVDTFTFKSKYKNILYTLYQKVHHRKYTYIDAKLHLGFSSDAPTDIHAAPTNSNCEQTLLRNERYT